MDKKYFFKLAIPIIIQQLIQASLNMVDTVMIGRLGSEEIAAVGIANQVFFFTMLIIFGINSGASVFIAQFFGRKDYDNIRKTMGVSLIAGAVVGITFCSVAVTLPKHVMSLFIDDKAVINFGVKYLRIIGFSYIFMAISMSFSVASRSIGKMVMPMIITGTALSVNTFLNYVLIFGKFGFPELGIEGAAIATTIARIVEFVCMIVLIYGTRSLLATKIKDFKKLTVSFAVKIFVKAGPVLLNEIFWSLGTIVYMWSVSQINAQAVASYQITLTAYRFYEVAFIGFASAVGVMIGNSIGAGEEANAIQYAKTVSRNSIFGTLGMSIVMLLLSPMILGFYKVEPIVIKHARYLFYVYCIYGNFRVFNLIKVVGILRGGGDTLFAMLTEMGCVWLVGVPLALLGSLVFKLNVVFVVWLLMTEEIVKAILTQRRFKSEKWVHNVIKHIN